MATRSTDKPTSGSARTLPAPPLPTTGPGPALDPRLLSELTGPRWEQSWALTPTLHTTALDPGARQRHWTLAEMLREPVRDVFALSVERTVLDLRCGEGWLCQQLLGRGARGAVGVDERADALRRARLLRDHFAISPSVLELIDGAEWTPPAPEDRFDVVLLTGMPERVADPELLARAFDASASICVLECAGPEANAVAAVALEAGFASVDRLRPPLQGAPVYVTSARDVLVAKVGIGR